MVFMKKPQHKFLFCRRVRFFFLSIFGTCFRGNNNCLSNKNIEKSLCFNRLDSSICVKRVRAANLSIEKIEIYFIPEMCVQNTIYDC